MSSASSPASAPAIPALLYHVAWPSDRDAITREGLRPARELFPDEYGDLAEWQSAGDADHVWLTDAPRSGTERSDAWAVATAGLAIELGEQCDCPGEGTGVWYIASHIPPAALTRLGL